MTILPLVAIVGISLERSNLDRFGWLATADLREAKLSERPRDWTNHAIWWDAEFKRVKASRGLPEDPSVWDRATRTKIFEEIADRWVARMRAQNVAILRGRDLRRADLSGAFLAGADLRSARLDGVKLLRADLQGADLRRASLIGTDLRLAGLEGADFAQAEFHGSDLSFARMADAILIKARIARTGMVETDLTRADMRYPELTDISFERANLTDARFNPVNSQNVDFNESRMDRVDLSRQDFSNTWIQNSSLRGSDLSYMVLDGTDLTSVDFSGAAFVETSLKNAVLSEAVLDGADLAGWKVDGAVLVAVDLSKARNLTAESLANTFGNRDTILPPGMPRPCQWPDEETEGGAASSMFPDGEDEPAYLDRRVWERVGFSTSASMLITSPSLDDWIAAGRPAVQRNPDGSCPEAG